jgi:chromosome segregation ATPase
MISFIKEQTSQLDVIQEEQEDIPNEDQTVHSLLQCGTTQPRKSRRKSAAADLAAHHQLKAQLIDLQTRVELLQTENQQIKGEHERLMLDLEEAEGNLEKMARDLKD